MERQTEIIICQSMDSLPSVEYILAIPRETSLKITFEGKMRAYRESIGEQWRQELPFFFVGIHMVEPEINIAKLITQKEISDHQLFFERCARDYNFLACQLIQKLANYLGEVIEPDTPMNTFGKYFRGRQKGTVDSWHYFLHGAHCGFLHQKTRQCIEVNLTKGREYGALDPYFFTRYIKSTEAYHPLPVAIFEDYLDGLLILEEMVALGRFERVETGVLQDTCVVVARDR